MGRSIILGYGLPLAGVAALIAGATTVMRDQPSNPVETPSVLPPVSPAAAGVSSATSFVGATGMVESAGRNIEIAPAVGGVIDRVAVEAGQAVRRGDVLLVVDSRSAEATVAQRRADLSAAEARVLELLATIPAARARVGSVEAQVGSARAATERARGDLARAEADLGDRQNLLRIAESAASGDARAVSMEVLESRRFAVRSAEATLAGAQAWVEQNEASIEQARAGLAEARASLATLVDDATGADGASVLAARASVEQSRAALDLALTEVELRLVRAPVDGRVFQVQARPGQYAAAGVATTPLIVMGVVDPLHVRAQIDEVDVPRFDPNGRAWASARGAAERRLVLRLVAVEPLVVPKRRLSGATNERVDTRVLEVVYALPDGAEGVYVGQQLDVYVEARGVGVHTATEGQR